MIAVLLGAPLRCAPACVSHLRRSNFILLHTHTFGFACARLQCGLTCGRASGAWVLNTSRLSQYLKWVRMDQKVFQENSLMRHGTGIVCRGPSELPRLRSGFRLRAQTPAERLNFDSAPMSDYGNTSWRGSAQGDRLEKYRQTSGHSRGRLCSTFQDTAGAPPPRALPHDPCEAASLFVRKTWLEK
jgi:hypothetical protein